MPYDIDPKLEQIAIRKGYGGGQRRGLTQAIDIANLNAQPALVQNLTDPGNPSDANANTSWHSRREHFEKSQELMRRKIAEEHEKKHPTQKVQDHVPILPRNYSGHLADNTVGAQGANYTTPSTVVQERVNDTFTTLFANEEFKKLYDRLSIVNNTITIDAESETPIRVHNSSHPLITHCVQHYSRLFPDEIFPLIPEQFFSSLLTSLFKDVSTDDFLAKLQAQERDKNVSTDDFISDLKVTQQPSSFDELPSLAAKTTSSYVPPVPQASAYASYSTDVDLTSLDGEREQAIRQEPIPQPEPTLIPVNDVPVARSRKLNRQLVHKQANGKQAKKILKRKQ